MLCESRRRSLTYPATSTSCRRHRVHRGSRAGRGPCSELGSVHTGHATKFQTQGDTGNKLAGTRESLGPCRLSNPHPDRVWVSGCLHVTMHSGRPLVSSPRTLAERSVYRHSAILNYFSSAANFAKIFCTKFWVSKS